MAEPIAGATKVGRSPGRVAFSFVSHPVPLAIVTAMVATLIGAADKSAVEPLGCTINWTRTGGVWIFFPDCSNRSRSPQPPPDGPAPGPVSPPSPPPTP